MEKKNTILPVVTEKHLAPSIQSVPRSETSGHTSQPTLEAKAVINLEKEPKKRFFARPWGPRQKVAVGALGFVWIALIALTIALPIYFTKTYGFAKDTDSDWQIPQPNEDSSYRSEANRPVFALMNFPDPGLIEHNGTWFAYGTNPKKKNADTIHVPVATSTNFVNWTLHEGYDALPTLGVWEKKVNHWAPDVIQRDDGKFVMYYSGEVKNWRNFHCVGVAVSNGTDPLGPYIPEDKPLACPHDLGGAIDPSPFRDADGTLYVVYKGDGNSIGHGGNCNNGKKPIMSVPILLQELKSDGVTTVGKPKKILDIDDTDGPLVEAPDLMRTDDGVYYLFFSSHCYTSLGYNVKYAHSTSIKGPYKRADRPLLQTADWDLLGPGGATISADGKKIVFHANCGSHRCMYAGAIDIKANNTVVMSNLLGNESSNSTNSTVSSR